MPIMRRPRGRKWHNILILALVLVWFSAKPASATVVYSVTVNTTSLNTTSGNLDFQFNPGASSQSAFADITMFTTDGMLVGAPTVTGDVTGGPLPASLTFHNTTAFNDYFHQFTFGTTFSFQLTLYGPAVDMPNGTSTSGSTFGLALYAMDGSTPLLNSGAKGDFLLTVDINLNGSTTVTNAAMPSSVLMISQVPEPATLPLFGAVLGVIAGSLFLRRKRAR